MYGGLVQAALSQYGSVSTFAMITNHGVNTFQNVELRALNEYTTFERFFSPDIDVPADTLTPMLICGTNIIVDGKYIPIHSEMMQV